MGVGEGRRDNRQYTKKGALKKSHRAGKGCAVTALALLAVPVSALAVAGYGIWEAFS